MTLDFFPVFISVFIAHIHQALFRKSDVITFMTVICDIFLVLHFIILCRQQKEMPAQSWP